MANIETLHRGDPKAASAIAEVKRVIYDHYTGGSLISALGVLEMAKLEIFKEQQND